MKDVRGFDTGAKRDVDDYKLDLANALSPIVYQRYGEYKVAHRKLVDGTIRGDGNWKLGIPKDSYMSSMWRHLHDVWLEHEGYESREGVEDALMGLLFNVQGYAHEVLKERGYGKRDE